MWPRSVIQQFRAARTSSFDATLYGAFNKLLHVAFPPESDFTIVPNWVHYPSPNSANMVAVFEVTFRNVVVLLVEVNAEHHLQYAVKREASDLRVRERLKEVSGK